MDTRLPADRWTHVCLPGRARRHATPGRCWFAGRLIAVRPDRQPFRPPDTIGSRSARHHGARTGSKARRPHHPADIDRRSKPNRPKTFTDLERNKRSPAAPPGSITQPVSCLPDIPTKRPQRGGRVRPSLSTRPPAEGRPPAERYLAPETMSSGVPNAPSAPADVTSGPPGRHVIRNGLPQASSVRSSADTSLAATTSSTVGHFSCCVT